MERFSFVGAGYLLGYCAQGIARRFLLPCSSHVVLAPFDQSLHVCPKRFFGLLWFRGAGQVSGGRVEMGHGHVVLRYEG